MRFGIWMVAGILEKPKRLRNAFLFAIRNTSQTFLRSTRLRHSGTRAELQQQASNVHEPRTPDKKATNGDTQMRLRGQHVPEAPCTAHGQMNFVFSAPVCLFPVPPPAGQLLIRVMQPSPASRVRTRGPLQDEVGSGAVSDYSSTDSVTPPVAW